MPDDDTTAIFRRSWGLYDFITERNYMFHREIYGKSPACSCSAHKTAATACSTSVVATRATSPPASKPPHP